MYEQLKNIMSLNSGDGVWIRMLPRDCSTNDLIAAVEDKDIPSDFRSIINLWHALCVLCITLVNSSEIKENFVNKFGGGGCNPVVFFYCNILSFILYWFIYFHLYSFKKQQKQFVSE